MTDSFYTPEVQSEGDRPKLFKTCPVCNAETPPGTISCPKCGVNLEIARSNLIKDMALEVGKYGFSVGQSLQKPAATLPSPPKSIKHKDQLEKPLGSCSYLLIGFIFANFTPVLLYLFVYVIPVDDVSLVFAFLSLLVFFSILYFSTIGRYGKLSFYGVVNIFVLLFIPIVNWWAAYYLGRGIHMKVSKQQLHNPHKPTSIGLVLIILTVGIAWLLSLPAISPAVPPTPTPKASYFHMTEPSSSPKVILTPTPTPTPCLHWSKITTSMNGRSICVYGTIYQITSSRETFTRIEFTDRPNTFFLYSVNLYFTDETTGRALSAGDCVSITGKVDTISNVPYIDIREETLYFCESWMK